MPSRIPSWTYSLPATLLLMAPFDILASLAMDIFLPAVPDMPRALGTSPFVIQLTLSLYMIVLGAGQIIFGPLSDRIGRRPVLICGAVLFCATSFGLAGSSTGPVFLALRLGQAIGASAALVATFATVRDVYADRPESTTIYGLFGSMLAFVPALGPIAGAFIADSLGWRAIFAVLGVVTVPAILNAWFRWHETCPEMAVTSRRSMSPILRSTTFWTYTLSFSAAMGTFFIFFSTASRILIERGGYSQIAFSFAFATVAAAMIATSRLARPLIERWGTAGSVTRGMVLIMAGAALLGAGEFFGSPSFWTFILPMWVIAAGIVFTVSAAANGALKGFDDIAGSAVALYFCVQSLITGGLGTLSIVAFGGNTAWPVVAYAALLPFAVLICLHRLQRSSPPKP